MKLDPHCRVLVTGATGFLGGQLVQHLNRKNCEVIATGRNAERCQNLRSQGHSVFQWDIVAPLAKVPQNLPNSIDVVVHCAALSSPFGRRTSFQNINVDGTRNVLDLAEKLGAQHFVLISSPSVYFALKDQLNVREDMNLPPPFNDYAATKATAEKLVCRRSSVRSVILRPRGIYGAGDTTLLPRLIRAARARPLPIFRNGKASIDLTHVDDVVGAVEHAIQARDVPSGDVFNISSGQVLPISEIVHKVCERTKLAVRWRHLPLKPALVAAGVMEQTAKAFPVLGEPIATRYGLALFAFAQSLDITKAYESLGWTPKITFDQGLDLTFREEGIS